MANLEKLRKSRGHERAAATKTTNAVELEVTKAKEDIEEEELEYLVTSLDSHLEKLTDLNSNVYELMMEMDAANEDFEDERTAADKYLKKLSKVSDSPWIGGELKDWLGWWAQFQKIHEDKDLHSSDKIQYFCQSVVDGTRAKELIESYPQTSDNYPKVIEALKSRFGRKDLLIEVYVRKLLKLVIENSLAKGNVKISCIFDKLESYLRALESIGVTFKNYAAMLYPLVESCLPEDLLRIWHRMRSCNVVEVDLDSQGNRLVQLLGFFKSEVESEERICLAREGFGVGTTHPKGKKQPVAEVPMPTAAGLFSGEIGRSGKSLCCFCEKTHSSHECFQARKMSLSDKKQVLSSKRYCFSCLKIGDPAVKCRNRVNCFVCGRRHYAIICPDLPIHKIEYHLENAPPPLIKTGKKLSKSFYVDNCITSVDSKEELNCFIKESTELMSTAKFNLRLWEYSSQHENAQVLGLLWDKEEDMLFCDVKDVSISLLFPTRRNILSLVQRVFDPIGFTCPALVSMKIFLQKSWALKTGWDEELPEEMGLKFKKWVSEVKMLSEVRIPRHLSSLGCPSDGWSLHTFCDASGLAYSAVVFLRCMVGEQVEVKFIQAKSRISPLKKLTIPRLELLAATIGSRLTATVVEGLGLEDVRRYFWNDSTTVLNWIARDDYWGAFVGNRVKEICQLTRREEWGHVPGKCNPADLPSRGCTVRSLVDSHWWEGPNWLKVSEEFWPKSEVIPDKDEIEKEKKKSVVSFMLC